MILFYRHPAAPYQFNGAVSGANADWREHFRRIDLAEELAKQQKQPDLFGEDFAVEMSEKDAQVAEQRLDHMWSTVIASHIRALLVRESALSVESQFADIYGATLGLAREKHLRAAWDQLADEGLVHPRQKSAKLRKQTIVRA